MSSLLGLLDLVRDCKESKVIGKIPLIKNALRSHHLLCPETERQGPSGLFQFHSEAATPSLLLTQLPGFDKGQMRLGVIVPGFKSMRQLTAAISILGWLRANRTKVEAVFS